MFPPEHSALDERDRPKSAGALGARDFQQIVKELAPLLDRVKTSAGDDLRTAISETILVAATLAAQRVGQNLHTELSDKISAAHVVACGHFGVAEAIRGEMAVLAERVAALERRDTP